MKIPEENLSQALEVVQKHFVGADIDVSELGTLPAQKTCIPCDATAQRHPIVMPPGELFLASIKRSTCPHGREISRYSTEISHNVSRASSH